MADPPTAVEVMQHQGRAAERTLTSSRQHTRVGFPRTKLLDKQASRGRRSRGSSRGNRQCPSPLVSNCAHASVAALVICLSARCAITEAAARRFRSTQRAFWRRGQLLAGASLLFILMVSGGARSSRQLASAEAWPLSRPLRRRVLRG